MAKDVPQMVRGLGMAVRLLATLTEEIKNRGGHEEMLHFLTTERGKENLGQVAELIAKMDWRIPKFLVMQMALDWSLADNGGDMDPKYAEADQAFNWASVLETLHIPYSRFGGENDLGHARRPLPREVRDQLHGKTAVAGMQVTMDGDEYIVTLLWAKSENAFSPGKVINENELGMVDLSPARYFDLDR